MTPNISSPTKVNALSDISDAGSNSKDLQNVYAGLLSSKISSKATLDTGNDAENPQIIGTYPMNALYAHRTASIPLVTAEQC